MLKRQKDKENIRPAAFRVVYFSFSPYYWRGSFFAFGRPSADILERCSGRLCACLYSLAVFQGRLSHAIGPSIGFWKVGICADHFPSVSRDYFGRSDFAKKTVAKSGYFPKI